MKKVVKFLAGAVIMLVVVQIINAQNSILSEGNWIKIAVDQTGIHQITYNDIVSYGIDPAQVNPKHIMIYGNGNGMLPEDNNEFRYDDLQENTIYVFGEEDGVFDPEDFILFYGESPTEWNFNDETGWFEHELNLYSDFTYYFITTDLGEGKRIESQNSSPATPTFTSTSFNDYYFHEMELENLIHSGRKWFGERFADTLEYNFQIEFPNLLTSYPVSFITEVGARSWEVSNFNFEINGQQILSIDVPATNFQNYSDYAKTKWDSVTFLANNPILNLSVIYDNSTGSSIGWLNYFNINVVRQNIFETGQMTFRDTESVGQGNVTEFQITTSNQSFNIWNITDPLNSASVNYNYSGQTASFTLETDSLLEFIIFDESQYFSPQFVSEVENQNLHAIEPPDMIIITHEDFKPEAQQLAGFRESFDGFSTFVTTPEKIYNEFSSGAQDITAIRDFVKYLYEKSNGEKPENLLLFGDATYDFKNINKNEINFMPVWESPESLHPVSSYCTDDFYSEFDEVDKTSMLRVGIGRLPVKTPQEANAVVEKIIHYSSAEEAFGNWRNEIVTIADDEDGNLHLNDAEDLAFVIDTTDRTFNISKIYLDAYEQLSTPNGQTYPEVNQAITDKINEGVNIIAHIGHGYYNGLASEKILTEENLENWENDNFYPLFFTASCSFGQFDDPEKYSLTEKAILMEGKGMSAIIAATRATYAGANHAFQKNFFVTTLNNPEYTLGKSLKLAKQQSGGFNNNKKYCLFGDPAMRPAIPDFSIITEAINGVSVTEPLDTINPGEQIIATGYLTDKEGNNNYSFNGTMKIKVFDRAKTITTLGNDPNSIITEFSVQDSVILELQTNVTNGQFAFSFNLPSNLDEEYGTIKLSYYAIDGSNDAGGYFSDIVVGGKPNSTPEYYQSDKFISFYPTVVSNQLNYLSNEDIEILKIEIFDLSGKTALPTIRKKVSEGEQKQINVSQLQKGMYILRAGSNNKMNSFKIIKQ